MPEVYPYEETPVPPRSAWDTYAPLPHEADRPAASSRPPQPHSASDHEGPSYRPGVGDTQPQPVARSAPDILAPVPRGTHTYPAGERTADAPLRRPRRADRRPAEEYPAPAYPADTYRADPYPAAPYPADDRTAVYPAVGLAAGGAFGADGGADGADGGGPTLLDAPQRRSRRAEREQAERERETAGLSRRNLLAGLATAGVAGGGATTAWLLTGSEAGAKVVAGAPGAGSVTGGTAANPSLLADTVKPAGSTTAPKKKAGFALPRNLDPDLLISRATYGRTAALENEIDRLGATKWLNAQLSPSKLKDPGGADLARRYPRLQWSATMTRQRLKEGAWDLMQDTVAVHLGRAVWSTHQLQEVMVDLWANHLNVTCPSGDVWDTRHRYQIDVIRKHALGKFEDMLRASAFHPAMLVYLNNAQSTGQQPNENYSRELLELHTVGVDGGYTERDVKKGALLLTGWVVENGKSRFDPTRHHVGSVKVMGFHTANASAGKGPAAQKAYLDYLAHHPRTAFHIATKLARRFLGDFPPVPLVKHLAATYRKHDTAIVPVLRELFASPEFAASKGLKIRRPMEHVVATARALGVKPGSGTKGVNDFVWVLNDMGHNPLGRATPDGYPDVASAWQSPAGALAQFNTTTTMVHGWWPNALALPGPKKLLSSTPNSRNAAIDAVGRKVFGRAPTKTEAAAARKLLSGTKLPSSFRDGSWEQEETIALTATLFLNSPAHALR